MSVNPRVRSATHDDAALLVELLDACFGEYAGVLHPPSGALSQTVETVRETLGAAKAYIAEMDAEPVGCVFSRPEEDYLYLFRLGVRKEHRRNGVARTLIDAVEHEALESGIGKVRLGTRLVLPANIRYYEGKGYVQKGQGVIPGTNEPFYVIMEKHISGVTIHRDDHVSGVGQGQ